MRGLYPQLFTIPFKYVHLTHINKNFNLLMKRYFR